MTEPLDAIAAIRKRPGMYTGDVHDGSGLHHLLWEVLGNAVDEHLGGFCSHIAVTLHDEARITVEDDGRGVPIEPGSDGVPFIEAMFTRMHPGATFDGHVPHVHLDGRGLGLVIVNAISRETIVETTRNGRRYRQAFRAGFAAGSLVDLGGAPQAGTRVTFAPDPAIFTSLDFDATRIRERLHQIAGLCPGLTLGFVDERRSFFTCPNGILDLLARECREGPVVPEPALHASGVENGVRVEVALAWANDRGEGRVRSFVNLYETHEGGSHVTGLVRGVDELAAGSPGQEHARVVNALLDRLVGIITVSYHNPQFDNPTKARLKSPEVQRVVEAIVRRCLRDFATSRPEELRQLLASACSP